MIRQWQRLTPFQAQTKPHFLQNVLETIHYMIVLDDSQAIKMVHLLGNLFLIGIGKGKSITATCLPTGQTDRHR